MVMTEYLCKLLVISTVEEDILKDTIFNHARISWKFGAPKDLRISDSSETECEK